MSLAGQAILITGAAGLIGSSVAQKVFDLGATVLLTDISVERLQSLSQSLSLVDSSRVYSFQGDVTTSEGIDLILNYFITVSSSPIKGAVHCAYPRSKSWGCDFEQLQEISLNYNLTKQLGGAILISQKVINLFHRYGGGSLVHISSIQGIRAPKFNHYEGTEMTSPIEYSAIKAGIISITSWLARYYSNTNIRVNCVSPGGIMDDQPKSFLKKYRESCCNVGMLQPCQVASSIAFLLSSDSFAVNGHNLIVDDGWSI